MKASLNPDDFLRGYFDYFITKDILDSLEPEKFYDKFFKDGKIGIKAVF